MSRWSNVEFTLFVRGSVDPSIGAGVDAPINALYFLNTRTKLTTNVQAWIKHGEARTAWKKILLFGDADSGEKGDKGETGDQGIQGPPGSGGDSSPGVYLSNADSVTLVPGTPVAVQAGAVRGNATNASKSMIVGLVQVSTDVTLQTPVLCAGKMTLTTAEWDTVTGQSGGLSPSATYYLSETPGGLSTTAPTALGSSVTVVGRASSSTALVMCVSTPIYL